MLLEAGQVLSTTNRSPIFPLPTVGVTTSSFEGSERFTDSLTANGGLTHAIPGLRGFVGADIWQELPIGQREAQTSALKSGWNG